MRKKKSSTVVWVVLGVVVGVAVLAALGGLSVAGVLYAKKHARANKDHTQAVAFNNSGLAWCEKKDYDRAIREYDQAIQLDPTFALAFNNRGLVWHEKKDYDRALQDYNEAIRLDPRSALASYNRGGLWSDKKDNDRALWL